MRKNLRRSWWGKIRRRWLPEVIFLIVASLAGLFFLLPPVVQTNFIEWLVNLTTFIPDTIAWFKKPSNIITLFIILGVSYFFLKRLRYHLLRRGEEYDQTCPVCENKTHKRHRKWHHYLLSNFIPVRRYYCKNCGWKGLRIQRRLHSHRK